MKGVVLRICAFLLCVVLTLGVSVGFGACSGGVYHNDDNKKSYDRGYAPTARDPLALTEDQEAEIKAAAAAGWNAAATAKYEAELKAYTDQIDAENSRVSAMSAAAESDKKLAESASKMASSKASSSSKSSSSVKSSSSGTISIDWGSNTYASVYEKPEFVKPTLPTLKDAEDVSLYNYGGTYDGYIAVRYKIKGSANVSAHQAENLKEDIIGQYNFSYYPDSPTMSLYKDGVFYTIREIYEAEGISERNLKDIWYYFYVED